ncbi:CBS domain-containing protein [Pedobacter sp. NJ-S-72]
MVPLMITSAIAYLINRSTNKYSIYTKPLAESGELMSHEDKDTTVLHMMKLKYLVEKDYLPLNEEETIAEKLPEILQSKRNIFPVIAEDNTFKGLIYVEDVLKKAINNPANPDLTVHDLMQTAPSIVFIFSDSMKTVLKKMEKENAWLLPVLNEQEQYIGFVSKTAVFNKYRALLSRQADYME